MTTVIPITTSPETIPLVTEISTRSVTPTVGRPDKRLAR
ncbi:MAG: hypothetical protein BWX50_00777 [Euryarchaeota archaeon ADurb.Bin009]|nr:MAG: hypothetical protein BWX50_00777 [Euryarchaeota archaeon ADurb.Bin009]